jgi:D-tyrosyl-tRNA(Tyr) deacylase
VILQRVRRAEVRVEGEVVGAIAAGMLLLVGVERGDGAAEVAAMADKILGLRIFADARGHLNLAAAAVGAEFLVVSQFTLAASLDRGRRPSFDRAAAPEVAAPLVASLASALAAAGHRVAGGRFGAHMEVELVNDGPVTFVLDVRPTAT